MTTNTNNKLTQEESKRIELINGIEKVTNIILEKRLELENIPNEQLLKGDKLEYYNEDIGILYCDLDNAIYYNARLNHNDLAELYKHEIEEIEDLIKIYIA